MKSLFDHIEYLKGKPHHIRRKVAFAVSGTLSGAIALVWVVGSLMSGSFMVPDTSFADAGKQNTPVITKTSAKDTSGLAGAAAAAEEKKAPAHIEIVDTEVNDTTSNTEQTTIPF